MGKRIELSKKTITEDKDGNVCFTGKVTAELAPVDGKDLANKDYVDNAIAQASIGGEVDTSGFALKTELPTKTSQLTNDSGFITSIPDEYVTSSEVQQMSEGFKVELDKKSDILNYNDHSLNGTETYNNLEKVIGDSEGSEVVYTINKPINLFEGTTCSVEVKFSDNTNLLFQGEVVSVVLYEKRVNCIQITSETARLMVMVIDKARYTIKDGSVAPEHDDNASSLLVVHPNANNVISLTITKPTTFEINNNFFTDYQFVNDTEKENWNNKADKSEIPNIEGLASESFVNQQISEAQEEVDYKIINSKLWYDISNEIEIDLAERNYNAYIPNTRFNVDDYVYTVLNTSLNLEKDTCYYLVIGTQKETGVSAIITGEYPVITQEITDGIIYAVCDSRITVYDNCDYVNGELIKADGKSVIKIKNAFSYPIKVARMSVMPTKYVPITDDFFNSHKFVSEEQLSQISTTYEQLNLKADKSELFSGSYNDLTNKPCYDTRITERKTYTYTYSVSNKPENEFIKVSDDTYTIEEIKNFSNVTITFDYMDDTASKTYNCPMLSESDYSLFFFPDQSGNKNTACICNGIVYILLEDTGNTSAGTYFRVQADSDCIIEFSFDYLLSGEIKVLDEKYLANKPGRIVYTPSSDGSGDMLSGEIFNTCLNRAGAFSHAEGLDTWALGDVSHAEGSSTKAMGSFSHAEGYFTEVMGSFSHAEGCYTIASGACQHVEGRGNIEDKNNKYLHIVGNGTDSNRSNAHTLDWNGNAWFAGKATVSVQPTDNNDLTTKLYVDQSISQVNNDLQNQINELFQNVSSGKELIASAITDKGVDASEEETFQSLSEKINQIPVGPPGSNIIGYVNENNDIYVSLTELESGTYTLKFEDYTGLLNEFDDIGTVEV